MKRSRLRRALPVTALALVLVTGWYWLAPTQLGGSTTYVTTNGISMEPRFHTGDLALVRPLSTYRVGQIVAYHSSLLHVTVLHRIIALDGDRYVFKGDNNNFVDPTRPVRSQLVGALWLRVAHGGVLLRVLHAPLMVGTVLAIAGVLLLWGAFETRRRRRGRARASARTGWSRLAGGLPGIDLRPFQVGSAVAAGLALATGLFAFAEPSSKTVKRPLPYTQTVHFGYSASVAKGPVYPDGVVHTGQPVFLQLAGRLHVSADYRLLPSAPATLAGVEQLLLVVTGPSGWSRTFVLSGPRRFRGPRVDAQATLDLPGLERLLNQIQRLTGVSGVGGASISVDLRIQMHGKLGGHRLQSSFAPALGFGLQPLQLLPESTPSAAGAPSGGAVQTRAGSIPASATGPNHIRVFGHAIAVAALRWLSILAFLLCAGATGLLFVLIRLQDPFAESERIRSRWGHLLVPVVAAPQALEQVPYDVPDIAALARLAESGQRLILHHRDPIGDTYLVSDDTTVYRYRPGPSRVVWGEWSAPVHNGHSAGHGAAPDPSASPVGVPVSAFEAPAVPNGRRSPGLAQLALAAVGVLVGLGRGTRR